VAQTFSIGIGDTGPDLVENLYEVLADGTVQPANLTGVSNLRFHLRDASGTEVINAAATLITPFPAQVSYTWSPGDTAAAGMFLRRWTYTVNGEDKSTPNDVDGYPVEIVDPNVTPATNRLTCSAWCTPGDVVVCGPCSGTTLNLDAVDFAIQVASDLLFYLSGRQFTGVCPDTIRPIRDDATGNWWRGIGEVQVDSSFVSRDSNYRSADFVNDRRNIYSELRLPAYPIRAITQVRIDGQVVPSSQYRIADDRFLLAVNGQSWPYWQDLTKDPTQVGTFEVQYTYGVPIPPLGVRAAAAYACQVALACGTGAGDSCALPVRTQQIVRQGLTVRTNTADDYLDNGKTGVPEADAFIRAVNPHGLQERAAVMSPDFDWPAYRIR
jgi:hypothetical protein